MVILELVYERRIELKCYKILLIIFVPLVTVVTEPAMRYQDDRVVVLETEESLSFH